jgi:hypothetical protein
MVSLTARFVLPVAMSWGVLVPSSCLSVNHTSSGNLGAGDDKSGYRPHGQNCRRKEDQWNGPAPVL